MLFLGRFGGTGHFALLLPLHAPVLKPDLNLAFGQAESVSNLDASPPGEVAVEMKLFLQLEGLIPGVRLTPPLPV